MEGIKNSEANILSTCYKVFIDRAIEWYGFAVHHVKLVKRKDSHMGVETGYKKCKDVPVLEVNFREETYKKLVDERDCLTEEVSDNLRDMWWDILHPYEEYIDRDQCFDDRMLIEPYSYEQRCFLDFISNRQNEVSSLLEEKLGKRPNRIYPSNKGFNIVYETVDYMFLGIGRKSKSLEKAIYEKAQDYVMEKYRESMDYPDFFVKFWNPNMRGYNGYWLWLG